MFINDKAESGKEGQIAHTTAKWRALGFRIRSISPPSLIQVSRLHPSRTAAATTTFQIPTELYDPVPLRLIIVLHCGTIIHTILSCKQSFNNAIRTYKPLRACLKYADRGSESTSGEISSTRGSGCMTTPCFGKRSITC